MRITLSALIVSAGLMLSGVAQANMSSLDPEHFLYPDEQETLALIAADLAAAGQNTPAAVLPQQPEGIAAIEITPAVEPQAAALEPAPERHEAEAVTTLQVPEEGIQMEVTGSLPVAETQSASPERKSQEPTLI